MRPRSSTFTLICGAFPLPSLPEVRVALSVEMPAFPFRFAIQLSQFAEHSGRQHTGSMSVHRATDARKHATRTDFDINTKVARHRESGRWRKPMHADRNFSRGIAANESDPSGSGTGRESQ